MVPGDDDYGSTVVYREMILGAVSPLLSARFGAVGRGRAGLPVLALVARWRGSLLGGALGVGLLAWGSAKLVQRRRKAGRRWTRVGRRGRGRSAGQLLLGALPVLLTGVSVGLLAWAGLSFLPGVGESAMQSGQLDTEGPSVPAP